ncbi:MAG: alanine--tRNA ligase, partial [Simkaniaceae bacterium]|nr:alanine--tRNA ligase [Simkaniaceae bacterium]
GAGLERVVSLMTEVDSIFETDVLRHIISKMEAISGRSYNPKDPLLAPAFHVVSDHLRTLSFAIADGVEPSNIERGYVLRKVLRRAVRYGKMLGMDKPFMGKLLPSLVETMGTAYHELNTAKGRIEEILSLEEEGFLRTLKRGGNMLNSIISSAKQASTHEISGEDAFKLKDTYGFPIEEILLLATDSDLKVDLNAFNSFEAKAKETSRSSKKETVQKVETSLYEEFLQKHDPSEFVGYDSVEDDGSVIGLIVNGVFVQKMSAEEEGIVLLDKTPFYAEKGGQVGDVGALTHKDAKFIVKDCKAPYDGVIAHIGKLEKGTLLIGEPMTGSVDRLRREAICKNHTATHLLHFALQKVLGEHIRQAGSLVEENRIRFDFNHHKPLSEEDVRAIESIINHKIWQGGSVKTEEISYSSIQNHPEIKQFFGDKYGDQVRLVSIDGFSKELCGGTHCNTLGSIGLFRITKEGSIAKGVRRIEAVIGMDAETFMYKSDKRLSQIAETLQVKTSQVEERVVTLSEENRTLKQSVKSMRQATLAALSDSLIKTANCINKINVIQAKVDMDPKELGAFADLLLRKMPSGIVILAAIDGDKCQIHVSVSPDLVKKGVYANALIKHISCAIKGGGGGKKETAQAGGKNPSGIDEALNLATEWIHDHH